MDIMPVEVIVEAMRLKRRIRFSYKGEARCVEVHTIGYSKEARPLMRGWQAHGGSNSGAPSPWRIFYIDEISNLTSTNEQAETPRQGYRKSDPAIHEIIFEL